MHKGTKWKTIKRQLDLSCFLGAHNLAYEALHPSCFKLPRWACHGTFSCFPVFLCQVSGITPSWSNGEFSVSLAIWQLNSSNQKSCRTLLFFVSNVYVLDKIWALRITVLSTEGEMAQSCRVPTTRPAPTLPWLTLKLPLKNSPAKY